MSHNTASPATRGPDITPADAFAASGEALLLDVREPEEWAAGHAPGARHIPLGDLDPRALDVTVAVIAVCRSGNRSGTAADVLAAAGISVRNMSGGMLDWQQQGMPVVRNDGSAGSIG